MQYLLPIIIVLNLSYLYFWIVALYARSHHHIADEMITNKMLVRAFNRRKAKPFLIQITTKGGSMEVVKRGIDEVIRATTLYPALKSIVRIEVITENSEDTFELDWRYETAPISVKSYLLPADYETPLGTQLKARALHYMVEQHRKAPTNSYVVHYDEESIYTPDNLARLVHRLLTKPIGISEGTISYGLDYMQSHPICRTMEANRPFGCHECYLMMTAPPPLHLHGSNLVIMESIENEIGWDIGTYRDHPLIAEDLVFGLMAYLKFGGRVFGWHGVEMIEQPPFTIEAAYKQRERWIMGALQSVAHVPSLPGWSKLSTWNKFKIQVVIRARVLTYALGFPISVVSLMTWVALGMVDILLSVAGLPQILHLTWIAVPGFLMWISATQLGLTQNLRYAEMTRWAKFEEHLRVLILTPIAGLFDTAGPFVAVLKWTVGKRSVKWIPTPKLSEQVIIEA